MRRTGSDGIGRGARQTGFNMLKTFAVLAVVASLGGLAGCSPVDSTWSDAGQTYPLAGTGRILNALTVNGLAVNGVRLDTAAGFAVVSIELPDGTIASANLPAETDLKPAAPPTTRWRGSPRL